MNVFLTILIRMVSTELAKTAITLAINKLLEAKGDGITRDIAEIMLDAIAKSKANHTTADNFINAKLMLDQGVCNAD